MAEIINQNNFEEKVLEETKKVFVDFFAEWCGPCQMMGPIVDEVAKEMKDILVYKVNIDENPELAMKYGVMSIPTLMVFEGGEVKKTTIGAMSKEALISFINN